MTLPAMPSLRGDLEPNMREALRWMWGELVLEINKSEMGVNAGVPTLGGGTVTNWDPGSGGLIRVVCSGLTSLTGMVPRQGITVLRNFGADPLYIWHENNTSAADNRFFLYPPMNCFLAPGQALGFYWDTRWVNITPTTGWKSDRIDLPGSSYNPLDTNGSGYRQIIQTGGGANIYGLRPCPGELVLHNRTSTYLAFVHMANPSYPAYAYNVFNKSGGNLFLNPGIVRYTYSLIDNVWFEI